MTTALQKRFRPCVVIPTYNNPMTVRQVVVSAKRYIDDIIVVDDGSDSSGRTACEAIADESLASVIHRETNGGKGAAVKTGVAEAQRRGFTHVLQVDADGQHDLDQIPTFLSAAQQNPDAFVIGYPQYDASVNRGRLIARKITRFWVNLEVGDRKKIVDAMVGFRVYPLRSLQSLVIVANRMDFDVEVAVRLARSGVPTINLPVGVRYLDASEGGISHFRMFDDNLKLFWLHCRLCTIGCTQFFLRRLGLRR